MSGGTQLRRRPKTTKKRKRKGKTMKKNVSRVLTVVLILSILLSLTACGENAKKQEAIDSFNETSRMFNEVGALINENASEIDADIIADCQSMAELLQRYNGILSADDELTDEQYDEMIAWFESVQDWSTEIKAALKESFG